MNKSRSSLLRKRVIPLSGVLIVLVILVLSLNAGLQSSNQTFAFRVSWPTPAAYLPNNPQPNVYLQINYTGFGARNYTYIITMNSHVLTQGELTVTHHSAATIYAFSPVPANLQAQVLEQGSLVFKQNLTIS